VNNGRRSVYDPVGSQGRFAINGIPEDRVLYGPPHDENDSEAEWHITDSTELI
jgi:hypothetical protein